MHELYYLASKFLISQLTAKKKFGLGL